MATTLNRTDATGLSKERYARLLESEECLNGLVDSINESVKQIEGKASLVYPDPPDRFDIWTQIKYIAASLKDMRTFVDETNVHDDEYENWSLADRIRLLARARGQAATSAAAVSTITASEQERLQDADRCLKGMIKPVMQAFRLARAGAKYEPDGPDGDFPIWDNARYLLDQVDSISKECDKSKFTNGALQSASLSDRVHLLLAENKANNAFYEEYKKCLALLEPAIAEAHKLVDGSGTHRGDIKTTDDPVLVHDMRYVVNALKLVDAELNKHKVPSYGGADWADLDLEWRIHAITKTREGTKPNEVNGNANSNDVDLAQHFQGIFEKLYNEIENEKDLVFKNRVTELLKKVLPSGEDPTRKPMELVDLTDPDA